METPFEPGELDHLVNEILSESLNSASEEPSPTWSEEPFSVLGAFHLNSNNAIPQDHQELETLDIQDLLGGVGWEDLFIPKDLSLSSNSQNTPRHSPDTSHSDEGPSDFSETPWSPTSATSSTDGARFLCPVCGNPSGKHFYYGAQVCSSCRAFFRRSTMNSAARDFSCQSQQNCRIDSKSWKSCKFCRFQKCLSAGMKPTWVMNDEERSQRNAKRKRNRNKRGDSLSAEVVIGNQWTMDEENQVRGIQEDILSKMVMVIAEFYSSNPGVLDQIIECSSRRKPLDPLVIAHMNRYVGNGMTRIFSDVLVLKEINSMDRFLLLSRNFSTWLSFHEAIMFKNHQEVQRNQNNVRQCLKQIKMSKSPSPIDPDTLQEAMDQLSLEDNVEFSAMMNNFIQDPPKRERRKNLITSIQSWPKFSPEESLDDILITLMMMILISCPDSLQLQSEGLVSQIQNQYCYILYRYINSKRPGQAHRKLGEGMDLITKVREVARMGETVLTENICSF